MPVRRTESASRGPGARDGEVGVGRAQKSSSFTWKWEPRAGGRRWAEWGARKAPGFPGSQSRVGTGVPTQHRRPGAEQAALPRCRAVSDSLCISSFQRSSHHTCGGLPTLRRLGAGGRLWGLAARGRNSQDISPHEVSVGPNGRQSRVSEEKLKRAT